MVAERSRELESDELTNAQSASSLDRLLELCFSMFVRYPQWRRKGAMAVHKFRKCAVAMNAQTNTFVASTVLVV